MNTPSYIFNKQNVKGASFPMLASQDDISPKSFSCSPCRPQFVCTIHVLTSAVFSENNWWRPFCWHASTIRVGLYCYFLTYCFSLGTQAQPELGNTQEWFFLFRLTWTTSPTSKQMKEQVSEGWSLGGGWFGIFCPSMTTHDHTGNRELGLWEKQFTWQRTKYEREASILPFSLQHPGSIRMPDTHMDGFQVGCHSPWSMW